MGKQMANITREQVESVAIGTLIARSVDGVRFSEPESVVSIFHRGNDIHGKAFVCFYTEFGSNASLSGSIKEDDATDARLYRVVEAEVTR